MAGGTGRWWMHVRSVTSCAEELGIVASKLPEELDSGETHDTGVELGLVLFLEPNDHSFSLEMTS